MKFKKHGEWHLSTLGKQVQCAYANEEAEYFIVRQYGEHEWTALNISVPRWGCGQIIARGQSDIDCYNKAVKEVNK